MPPVNTLGGRMFCMEGVKMQNDVLIGSNKQFAGIKYGLDKLSKEVLDALG